MKPTILRRFPLALCALGGALMLAACSPSSDTNAAPPEVADNAAMENSVAENAAMDNAVAENAVAENAAPAPTSAVKFSYLETIYVPGKDDLLHAQKVSRMAIDSQLKSGGNGAPALQEIIEKAPLFFPANAKVNNWKEDAKGVTVDLNRAFDDPDFWSTKGEKTTELAAYALVNSAAKPTSVQGTPAARPVRFTIEKKPAQTLGEFDLSGELAPQMRLVAK